MQPKNLKATFGGFMRLHEQTGYKIFDDNNQMLLISTESMTVSDIVAFMSEISGFTLFTQVKTEKEILLWSHYELDKNESSRVLFRLVGNPAPCCGR
jgi:hypothetical protein